MLFCVKSATKSRQNIAINKQNRINIPIKNIQYAFLVRRKGAPFKGMDINDTKNALGKKMVATMVKMRVVPESK
jgi:hypothetical protein